MDLEEITAKIKNKLSSASEIDAIIKFDFGDDGCVMIDATQNPPQVSNEDEEADLTLSCSIDVFENIVKGNQDPNIAFMMGKLKISGPMGLALKLSSMLED